MHIDPATIDIVKMQLAQTNSTGSSLQSESWLYLASNICKGVLQAGNATTLRGKMGISLVTASRLQRLSLRDRWQCRAQEGS